jgi:hypothetical protein
MTAGTVTAAPGQALVAQDQAHLLGEGRTGVVVQDQVVHRRLRVGVSLRRAQHLDVRDVVLGR